MASIWKDFWKQFSDSYSILKCIDADPITLQMWCQQIDIEGYVGNTLSSGTQPRRNQEPLRQKQYFCKSHSSKERQFFCNVKMMIDCSAEMAKVPRFLTWVEVKYLCKKTTWVKVKSTSSEMYSKVLLKVKSISIARFTGCKTIKHRTIYMKSTLTTLLFEQTILYCTLKVNTSHIWTLNFGPGLTSKLWCQNKAMGAARRRTAPVTVWDPHRCPFRAAALTLVV